MRVFVYWNLHKKCWSVRCVKTGKVIFHKQSLMVRNAEFVVSQAGRLRVLRKRRKNVHAGIRGELIEDNNVELNRKVRYNPYLFSSFMIQDSPIYQAEYVRLCSTREVFA